MLWAWKAGPPPEMVHAGAYVGAMGMAYLIGAVLYSTRIPERFAPGRFDLVLSSHNIFHVLVVLGAYIHYHAAMISLKFRDNEVGCRPGTHHL